MLELNQLRALQAVSTSGSINGAAEVLHITNSAVSQRLAKLERDVGQTLLERHGRGIRLTGAAKLLVHHAEQILSLVDVAQTALEDHRGLVVGELSVATFPAAARGLLSTTADRLRADHPQLRLLLHEQDPYDALPRVARGDLDIAVVHDAFNTQPTFSGDLGHVNLMQDVMDLALPVTHPLAGRDIIELSEVAHDTWVSWPRDTVCGAGLREVLHEYGVDPRIGHAVSENATQLVLVAAGLGIALVPRLGRGRVPTDVWLARLTPTLARSVCVVWRAEIGNRPAVRATVRAFRAATAELTEGVPGDRAAPGERPALSPPRRSVPRTAPG